MASRLDRWLRPSADSTPLGVRFARVYAIEVRPAQPHVVAEHVHSAWEMLLIEAGTWTGTLNGTRLAIPAPGLLLVRPGDRHADHVGGEASFVSVILRTFPLTTLAGDGDPLATAVPAHAQACAVERDGAVARAVRGLLAEASAPGPLAPWLLDALAAALLWRALALVPTAHHAPWVAQARQATELAIRLRMLLDERIADPPGVATLARRLGIGQRALRARCRSELGDSPARLLARLRIERARELLAREGATVGGVAAALGFATQAHFARVYRRFRGRVPSADLGGGVSAGQDRRI